VWEFCVRRRAGGFSSSLMSQRVFFSGIPCPLHTLLRLSPSGRTPCAVCQIFFWFPPVGPFATMRCMCTGELKGGLFVSPLFMFSWKAFRGGRRGFLFFPHAIPAGGIFFPRTRYGRGQLCTMGSFFWNIQSPLSSRPPFAGEFFFFSTTVLSWPRQTLKRIGVLRGTGDLPLFPTFTLSRLHHFSLRELVSPPLLARLLGGA